MKTLLSMMLLHTATCFSPLAYQYKQYMHTKAVVHLYMRSPEDSQEKSLVDKVLRLDQANMFQRFGKVDDDDDDDTSNGRMDSGDDFDDDPDTNPFLDWMKKVRNRCQKYLSSLT